MYFCEPRLHHNFSKVQNAFIWKVYLQTLALAYIKFLPRISDFSLSLVRTLQDTIYGIETADSLLLLGR